MTKDFLNSSRADQPNAAKDFPEEPQNSLTFLDKVLLPLSRNQENIENKAQNRRQPNLLGHILITSSLAISIIILASSLNWYATNKAKEWLVPATVNRQLIFTEDFKPEPAIKERLNQQFDDIQSRSKSHLDVMIYFYKQSYVCGSMSLALAITSALCIFFISRDGWEKANNGLINAFLITTSAAFVCNQIPVIFKQENNLTGNRKLYLEYVALRNELISYAATGGTIGDNTTQPSAFASVNTNQFIHQIDRRLAELNQIAIDFDLSRVADVPEFQPGNLRTPPSPSKTPAPSPR